MALDRSGVIWALLEGAEDLADPVGDVDLLVEDHSVPTIDAVLGTAGLRRIVAPGYGSHRFYFAYEAANEMWLKLRIVSNLAFGAYHELRVPVAAGFLQRRTRACGVWRLHAEDEAWLLLLHLTLDKREIAVSRRPLAASAALRATPDNSVARFLDEICGNGTSERLLNELRAGRFDAAPELVDALGRSWSWRGRLRVLGSRYAHRAARRLAISPTNHTQTGLSVSVMGPDGAGKTTLAEKIGSAFPGPTAYVHMGIWRQSRWDQLALRAPGGRLVQRLQRVAVGSLAARYHRRRGRLVLLDRCVYDCLLPDSRDMSIGGRVVTAAMLRFAPRPELVFFLDAPGDVLFARSGEHSPELLNERRRSYQSIAADVPNSVVMDATQPPEDVFSQAVQLIWERYAKLPERVEPFPLDLWRRLDWRFLMPWPHPQAVLCAGAVDSELLEALRLLDPQVKYASSPIEWSDVPAHAYDVAVLVRPDLHDLKAAVVATRPGGWVYAEVRRDAHLRHPEPHSLRGWRRAFCASGLESVAAHWHAPTVAASHRIVPIASKGILRETLDRHQAVKFGRVKSRIGKLAVSSGLFSVIVPEGSVVGRCP